ncbi:hypothetical protein BC938DRAFT_479506 [Jimgerdemannia flammicorona]|uniref:Calcineurin-like phosphoesterase domain-containing protein n=1 Tax=Jimgerdemannia flammicorona TaxID=994334 RepID=A0A433QKQ7_9FUNG|nr:hypothetical protein BC938DRAFT_479506 [Jimgerdemannia flammicorona]
MVCMGNKNTLDFMVRLLEAEVPDLVVFTGDNVNGQSSSDVRAAILRYSRPVVDRRIPWAMVYGDHDDEGDLTREEMFQTIQEIPYALTEKGPVDVSGVGNYVVKIYKNISEETREEQSSGRQIRAPQQEHAFTLYFLDSHSQSNAGPGVYNHINQDQLDWLLMASRSFSVVKDGKEQSKPNAIAFVHAPIPEYNELELGGRPRAIMGDKRETVSSAPSEVVQGKIFETFRKGEFCLTSNQVVIDQFPYPITPYATIHKCSWRYQACYLWKKPRKRLLLQSGWRRLMLWRRDGLCTTTLLCTYGASHLNWPRRARVFELRDSTVTTWKRLDDDKLSMLHFETLVF